MRTALCAQCYLIGHCRRLRSRVVTQQEVTPRFVHDLRNYACHKGLKANSWEPYLMEAYRDYPGRIADAAGAEVELDTSVFDGPNIRTWFRDICRPPVPITRLRLRHVAIDRYIVMGSILRAIDPVAGSVWGKEIANDETIRASPRTDLLETNCPFPHFIVARDE